MVQLEKIKLAYDVISKIAEYTPVVHSTSFSRMAKNRIYMKLENLQKTGSFKIRGAAFKISQLTEKQKEKGVIAASAGNHAQGVALSASRFKIKSTIVMPKHAPLIKIKATEGYGAKVILHGETFDDAQKEAMRLQKKHGYTFIHAYDDEDIIAGQGTIGLEIINQIRHLDAVVIPIGGGGLISGIASAIKQINKKIKIIGVEAKGADAVVQSLRNKRLTPATSISTIADGIAVKHPGRKTYRHIKKYVNRVVTVTDEETLSAMLHLIERNKLIAEPAGAVALAAAFSHKLGFTGKKVCVIISGGNIDTKMISKIIERGMTKQKRITTFKIIVKDRPEGLVKVLDIIAECGANLIELHHDRHNPNIKVSDAEVYITMETHDAKHRNKILKKLRAGGYKIEH